MKSRKNETILLIISACLIVAGVLLVIYPTWNKTGSNTWTEGLYWSSPEGLRIITNYVLGAVFFISGVLSFIISPVRFGYIDKHGVGGDDVSKTI